MDDSYYPKFRIVYGEEESTVIRTRFGKEKSWKVPHKKGQLYWCDIHANLHSGPELCMAISYRGLPHFGVVMSEYRTGKVRLIGCWRGDLEWWIPLHAILEAKSGKSFGETFPRGTPPLKLDF